MLGGGEVMVMLLFVIFMVGIGLGLLFCEWMFGKYVEIGFVFFGLIGLMLFGVDFYFVLLVGLVGNGLYELLVLFSLLVIWCVFFDLMMFGMFGGFFIVLFYVLV